MSSAGDIRMGEAYVELFADQGTLEGDLSKAKQRIDRFAKYESAEFKKFASSVGGLGSSLKGAFSEIGSIFPSLSGMLSPEVLGLTALVSGAKEAISTFKELGKQVGTVSLTTGFSPEFISRMSAAIGGTDSFPILTKGMASFMMQLQAGSGESVAIAQRLGLSFENLKNMAPEERFKLLWNRVASIKDETTRAGYAMRVFGEGAVQILPALAKGQGYLDKWAKKSDEFGTTLSRSDVAKAAQLSGSDKEASLAWTGVKTTVGRDLANPVFSNLKKYAALTISGAWNAVSGRIGGDFYSEARAGGDLNRSLGLNWGARRFSDSELAAGQERVKARRRAAFGDREVGFSRQYYAELEQAEASRLQRERNAAYYADMPRQFAEATLKGKTSYFDANGFLTSRENAASAYIPKKAQDITTRISAMVPQSGTRLLENLGGLGVFSTGDVQKQQLDVQKESKRLLEQIARGKNAASYT